MNGGIIVLGVERFPREAALENGSAEFPERDGFLVAETEPSKRARGQAQNIPGLGKAVVDAGRGGEPHPSPPRQFPEQAEARDESELLARNRIGQGFEDRRKAHRFQAVIPLYERAQPVIPGGQPIEGRQIGFQAEHAPENASSFTLRLRGHVLADNPYGETGLFRTSSLGDVYFRWPASEQQHAAVACAIPSVHQVFRTPPQRPCSVIQPEGWNGNQLHGHRREFRRFALGGHRACIMGAGMGSCAGWRDECASVGYKGIIERRSQPVDSITGGGSRTGMPAPLPEEERWRNTLST